MIFFALTETMVAKYSVKDEIRNQGIALKLLAQGNKKLELALIALYGAEFRKIINQFKKQFKALPTPDDLIWVAGVHTVKDPRKVAKELAKGMK